MRLAAVRSSRSAHAALEPSLPPRLLPGRGIPALGSRHQRRQPSRPTVGRRGPFEHLGGHVPLQVGVVVIPVERLVQLKLFPEVDQRCLPLFAASAASIGFSVVSNDENAAAASAGRTIHSRASLPSSVKPAVTPAAAAVNDV